MNVTLVSEGEASAHFTIFNVMIQAAQTTIDTLWW